MTLFNGNPVDPEAYEKGQKAWNESPQSKNCKGLYPPKAMLNPYPVHSDQWHSWNKGWNSVEPEEEIKPAFSFTANIPQSTVDQLRTMNQPKEQKDANLYMVENENTLWGPFTIPGEQYEQIKRLADSQEEGTNDPE